MSSNPNDLMALTPGHFLIGEPLTSHPAQNTNIIGPLLLSPEKLKREIMNIKGHLPSSQKLAAQQTDLLMLHKIMSVDAGLTENHILFKITLPIIEAQEFNMLRIIPIPTTINGTLVSIKSTTDILAITAHGDKYYPMTQQQYKECSSVNPQSYLCPYAQSTYNAGAQANSCEVNLFNNESRPRKIED